MADPKPKPAIVTAMAAPAAHASKAAVPSPCYWALPHFHEWEHDGKDLFLSRVYARGDTGELMWNLPPGARASCRPFSSEKDEQNAMLVFFQYEDAAAVDQHALAEEANESLHPRFVFYCEKTLVIDTSQTEIPSLVKFRCARLRYYEEVNQKHKDAHEAADRRNEEHAPTSFEERKKKQKAEYDAEYRAQDHVKKRDAEYHAGYRQENKDHIKEYQAGYRAQEHVKERAKERAKKRREEQKTGPSPKRQKRIFWPYAGDGFAASHMPKPVWKKHCPGCPYTWIELNPIAALGILVRAGVVAVRVDGDGRCEATF